MKLLNDKLTTSFCRTRIFTVVNSIDNSKSFVGSHWNKILVIIDDAVGRMILGQTIRTCNDNFII